MKTKSFRTAAHFYFYFSILSPLFFSSTTQECPHLHHAPVVGACLVQLPLERAPLLSARLGLGRSRRQLGLQLAVPRRELLRHARDAEASY